MKGFAVCPHCGKLISIDAKTDLRIHGSQFELSDVNFTVAKAGPLKEKIKGNLATMMEKRFRMDKNYVTKLLKDRYELNSESSQSIIDELGIK